MLEVQGPTMANPFERFGRGRPLPVDALLAAMVGVASAVSVLCSGCEAYQLDPESLEFREAGSGDRDARDGEVADTANTALPQDSISDLGGVDVRDTEGVDARDTEPEGCSSDADAGCRCDYNGTGRGVCVRGTLEDDGECGAPDAWEADEERCDDLDNDCDGVTDEECPCKYLGKSEGVCGGQTLGSEAGICLEPDEYEGDEVSCDNRDNDCDGVTDQGCPCDYEVGDTGSAVGVCTSGERNENGSCLRPDEYESPETSCDSRDNDCDGVVDEDCVCNEGTQASCYTGPIGTKRTGICSSGTRTCQSDKSWGSCVGDVVPQSSEQCDGRDVDCDGNVDEGCPCDYQGASEGVCGESTIEPSGNCEEPGAFEQDESTCDALDNDCDGVVDEGCPCDYDGSSAGVCPDGAVDGTGNCTPPSAWESDETTCDDLDNDCDRSVDEGCDDDSDGWCDASLTVSGGPAVCSNGGGDCDDEDAAEETKERERAQRVKKHFEKGAAKYAEGDYSEAIVHFRRGQELYPSALLLYNIAMCHMHMAQSDRAVEFAVRALQSERRPLDGETDAKARGVVHGGGVVRSARSTLEASGTSPSRAERPPSRPAVGPFGWAGATGAVVGIGGLVASGVLAADINRSWDELQEASRGSDRETFNRKQDEIARKQRIGRALGIGGAALTLLGAGFLVGDLAGKDRAKRVRVRPTISPGATVTFTW